MQVFSQLRRSSDLANVARSCSAFRELGLRLIYRRIHWRYSRSIAQNLRFWPKHPNLLSVPTAVTISFGSKHDPSLVEGLPGIPTMMGTLPSFTNLETLTFQNARLPGTLHSLLYELPRLRRLHLQQFELEALHGESVRPHHTALPLRELEIGAFTVGETAERIRVGSWPWTLAATKVLSLVEAQGLQVLRLLWPAGMEMPWARIFGGQDKPSIAPACLEELEVTFRRSGVDLNGAEAIAQEQTTLAATSRPILAYALDAPRLRRLELHTSLELTALVVPPTAVPLLKEFKGPLGAGSAFSQGRQLEDIEIVPGFHTIANIMETLARIANDQQELRSLTLGLPHYDTEVLQGISLMFLALERLKLTFSAGGPSEVCS